MVASQGGGTGKRGDLRVDDDYYGSGPSMPMSSKSGVMRASTGFAKKEGFPLT